MDDLEDGKFDNLTQNQAMATVGKLLSKDDWKENFLPAFKDRKSDVKTENAIAEAVIKPDIKTFIKTSGLDRDLPAQDKIRRKYDLFIKKNPTASAEERLNYFKKLATKEKLESSWNPLSGVFWRPIKVRGIDKDEMEERGFRLNLRTTSTSKRL